MKILSKYPLVLGLLTLLWAWSAEAADPEKEKSAKVTTLEPCIVTATKCEVEASKITQKIDVITDKQINQIPLGNENVTEIFQYQPGTFVNPFPATTPTGVPMEGWGPSTTPICWTAWVSTPSWIP